MLYTGERNYGCRFLEVSLYGLRTIILENEKIRVVFILDKGTDIIEFVHKKTDTDFLWRSPQGLSCLKSTQHMRKDEQYLTDCYTGGWFEAFPNLGEACMYKAASLHFYGEVCYLPWEYNIIMNTPEEVSLHCFVRTVKTPFFLEKTLTVKSNVSTLFIDEKVTNLGNEALEFQWGHHPNFGSPFLDENCVIDLPEGKINSYSDIQVSRVGVGEKGSWPFIKGKDGFDIDFRQMLPKGAGKMDLISLSKLEAGYAGVLNTKKGVGIRLDWDINMFKNCILWMVANGDTGYPRYGDTYVLCILPKNSDIQPLSEGIKIGDATRIESKETISTWLSVSALESEEYNTIYRKDAI